MKLPQKVRVFFWAGEHEEGEEIIEEGSGVALFRSPDESVEEENGEQTPNGERTGIKEQVSDNAQKSEENRRRIIRIDERTALMARLLFVMFIGFIVSVGAGLIVAFAGP